MTGADRKHRAATGASAAVGLTLEVDLERCMGHGQCYGRDPELMEPLDDFGHARVRPEAAATLGPDDQARVDALVRNCPEHAIRRRRAADRSPGSDSANGD